MIDEILGWATRPLAFLPDYLRPWIFLAVVLAVLWGLLSRGWFIKAVSLFFVVVLGIGAFFSSLFLWTEYRLTKRRRRNRANPSPWAYSFGAYWESILDDVVSHGRALKRKSWPKRRWPVRTLVIVALLGFPIWLISAAAPAVASWDGLIGRSYRSWAYFEGWTGVAPMRQVLIVRQPPPTVRSDERSLFVTLGPRYPNTEFKIYLGHVSEASPLLSATTDERGELGRKVNSALAKQLASGRIVELRYSYRREVLRIS
jgi:hypothetical protein